MIDLLWAVHTIPLLQESIFTGVHIGIWDSSVAMKAIKRELLSTEVGDLNSCIAWDRWGSHSRPHTSPRSVSGLAFSTNK
jgi:hypothetical protein